VFIRVHPWLKDFFSERPKFSSGRIKEFLRTAESEKGYRKPIAPSNSFRRFNETKSAAWQRTGA
jgi:hypothetical protein